MKQDETTPPIELLVQSVQQSGKYRHIDEAVIRRIGLRQLAARRSLKQAVDATKSKLHQIAGAYLDSKPPYTAWLDRLAVAKQAGDAAFRAASLLILKDHASTRERCESLPGFYAETLGRLPPIRSVIDIGCGLNPLTIPWMPLVPAAVYYAYDIHTDLIDFLGRYFDLAGIHGQAQLCDAVAVPPAQQADVALVLKVLPVLEQQDRSAGLTLLRALQAQHLLVSFPTRTLCGRDKRMAANYEAHFRTLIQGEDWGTERFEFSNELCFLLTK